MTRSKRVVGVPALRLQVPEPELIRETRLEAKLSQEQACDLVGIKQVMSWSNYETRDSTGQPKVRMNARIWEYFLLILGKHPGFLLLPRLGIDLSKPDNDIEIRGSVLPSDGVTFTIEHFINRVWSPVKGRSFETIGAACAAAKAITQCSNMNNIRVTRYVNEKPDEVVAGGASIYSGIYNQSQPPRWSMRTPAKMGVSKVSRARSGWRR